MCTTSYVCVSSLACCGPSRFSSHLFSRPLFRTQLRSMYKEVMEALKEFGSVNKKALQQFSHFSSEREKLLARRDELDASNAAISNVIAVLDQKKDEAILRTFRDVAKHFSEVFSELTGAPLSTDACVLWVSVYV